MRPSHATDAALFTYYQETYKECVSASQLGYDKREEKGEKGEEGKHGCRDNNANITDAVSR